MKNALIGFVASVSVLFLAIALVMGFWWLLWQLWLYVVPAMWANGPEGFVKPSYWVFAGMWTLLGIFTGRIKWSKK